MHIVDDLKPYIYNDLSSIQKPFQLIKDLINNNNKR